MEEVWPLRELQLEIVNICNYQCPLCDTLKKDWVPRVKLSLDQAKILVDKTYQNLETVTLYGTRGEPLINKDLEEIICYIKTKSAARVSLSTNASLFRESRVQSLLGTGVDKIIIAIDGLTQETYSRYRVGGKLKNVIKGVQNLCAQKEKLLPNCEIVLQFIPMSTNEHELSNLKEFANYLGVDKAVIKLSSSVESSELFRTTNTRLSPSNFSEQAKVDICPFGLEKLYVDPNGYAYPCCYTEGNKDYLLGNLFTDELSEVWHNPKIWEIRSHFANQSGYFNTCKKCLSVERKKKVLIE